MLTVAFLLAGLAFLLVNAGMCLYLEWRDRTQEPVLTRSLLRPWKKRVRPPPAPINMTAILQLPRAYHTAPAVLGTSADEGETDDAEEEEEGEAGDYEHRAPPPQSMRLWVPTDFRPAADHPLTAVAAAFESSADELRMVTDVPMDAEIVTAFSDVDGGGEPIGAATLIGPHYAHEERLLRLPPGFELPTFRNCSAALRANATFWITTFYSKRYVPEAHRLVVLSNALDLCCVPSRVPDEIEGAHEGDAHYRHRLIALKPLFMLHTLRHSPLAVVYMDADLELNGFPHLFMPGSWDAPRDIAVFNWQANITMWGGRRLKAASGVLFLNKSAPAEALLRAWAEIMAHPNNSRAPDDQALDLLVNDGGWLTRAAWGWLPEAYLRMPRFRGRVDAVIDHRLWPGSHGNSQHTPVLPSVVRWFA